MCWNPRCASPRLPCPPDAHADLAQHPCLQWSCQVPLVLQTVYLYNYAHTVTNTAGWLFSRLVAQGSSAAKQLAECTLVAVATPWGLGLPAWARALLQPMARHPVTTLAE